MKNLTIPLLLLISAAVLGQTQAGSIVFDGQERGYRFYLPETYSVDKQYPLVFNLHGFGSNAAQQEIYSGMDAVAEENEFIVLYPQGSSAMIAGTETQFFNVGFTGDYEADPDDVGFISALIDSMAASYSIDLNRVYSCGMSNGGFMSYRLACQLEDRIAAIASVTGVMMDVMAESCQSSKQVPVLHIHGTNDQTVPYAGAEDFYSVQESLDYWIEQNSCEADGIVEEIEDIVTDDGTTVQKTSWVDCASGHEVILFRVNDGGHTWPDGVFDLDGMTNRDINASQEIWNFFERFTLDGAVVSTQSIDKQVISSSPNPFTDHLRLEDLDSFRSVTVISCNGQTMFEGKAGANAISIDSSSWPSGIYMVMVENEAGHISSQKVVKQ